VALNWKRGQVVAHWEQAKPMKTYSFKVVVESDGGRWHAYCTALVQQGGATWGYTKEEALKNIHEVIQMVVESLIEHGQAVPEEPSDQVQVFAGPQVAVIV
jgi:predicted RNase H-like HicB family nuclease